MDSKTKDVAVIDSNTVANGIMRDIIDVDRMESMFESELSSSDLFKIDCAILSTLRNTQDFSRDLLHQLEEGKFDMMITKPQKTFDKEIQKIQEETITDIVLPLQELFDTMAGFVAEALT